MPIDEPALTHHEVHYHGIAPSVAKGHDLYSR